MKVINGKWSPANDKQADARFNRIQVNPFNQETPIMAQVSIKFECGCGQHIVSVESALLHASATGHTLTIHGSVIPTPQEIINSKTVNRENK